MGGKRSSNDYTEGDDSSELPAGSKIANIDTDINPGNNNPDESIVDAYNNVKDDGLAMAQGGAPVRDVVEKVFEDTYDELEAFNAEVFVNGNGGT